MNIIEYAISLATLVLWTAGDRDTQAAEEAWKKLNAGDRTTTSLLPSKDGWIDKVKGSDGILNWESFIANTGPFGVLLEHVLPVEAQELIDDATEAAKRIAEDVKQKVIGRYVVAGVAGVTVIGLIATAVYVSRKKKRRAA